jgi:hypothetical protein
MMENIICGTEKFILMEQTILVDGTNKLYYWNILFREKNTIFVEQFT